MRMRGTRALGHAGEFLVQFDIKPRYELIVSGPSGRVCTRDQDGDCKPADVTLAAGVESQDPFEVEELRHVGLSTGTMSFEVRDGQLFTLTRYTSAAKLEDDELTTLTRWTQGQWSDGIGEGFEQYPARFIETDEEVLELYISPWFRGQKAKATQVELETSP